MSAREGDARDDESRQRLAAEVIELGEALFDLALEQTAWSGHEGEGTHAVGGESIGEELRMATSEFFRALHLLHGL